jgi:hypothetical protein
MRVYPPAMPDMSILPPAEFTRKAHDLYAQAVATQDDYSLFVRLMSEAKGQGMTWVQGLQFVIDRRHPPSSVNTNLD